MGVWGFGSDENDNTYDILGMSIGDRVQAAKLSKEGRQEFAQYFERFKQEEKTPGVVMWFLKQGISVPRATLRKTIRLLKAEKVDESWTDPSKRKKEIKREIKIIEKVIACGQAPKRLKVKGIFS